MPLTTENFTIGPTNTWSQAWQALLDGHPVRRNFWNPGHCLILEGANKELQEVQGKTKEEWRNNPRKHWPWVSVSTMLLNDWEVLAKVDSEPVTV